MKIIVLDYGTSHVGIIEVPEDETFDSTEEWEEYISGFGYDLTYCNWMLVNEDEIDVYYNKEIDPTLKL